MMFLHTNSSSSEDSEEEISIPTTSNDSYFADLENDDYSADAELDPTYDSIYESEEKIESGSWYMNCSRGDDSDVT